MSGNKNKLIAFNYFGGKFTWLEYLYRYFPNRFTHLIDLFAGSLAVSLNYKGNVIRTANEINADITNFFYVLRDHEPELIRLLLLTPCSELEYNNKSMNIKPLAGRVLILPAPAEEKTIGGIIIPDTAKQKPLKGEIVAAGNGTKDEEMELKVGDTVLYGQFAGTELEVEGSKYLVMRQCDVLAILG